MHEQAVKLKAQLGAPETKIAIVADYDPAASMVGWLSAEGACQDRDLFADLDNRKQRMNVNLSFDVNMREYKSV